jgi:uncharacterized membrane-anchored protein
VHQDHDFILTDTSEDPMKHPSHSTVVKYDSLFLGTLMFVFGFLKLFEPFRTWFDVQITKSGLPRVSIPAGIAGEMIIGTGLLSTFLLRGKAENLHAPVVFVASAALIGNMGIAVYVHLQPEVPANVLPLGIKAPVIPSIVLLLAAVNLLALRRENERQR